jgi:protein ImuB
VNSKLSKSGSRYLAVWFPFLSADRLLRQWAHTRAMRPAGRPAGKEQVETPSDPHASLPLVLVHKIRGATRLAAVSRAGLDLGLGAGLTLADARARVPDLMVVDHDPQADARLLETLADDCERFTPLTALDGLDGLILDISGCAHLSGGEQPLRQRIFGRFERTGLTCRISIASSPDSARAHARFGHQGLIDEGTDATAARPLPVAALDTSTEILTALTRAGLKTLGDLLDRPSQPLSARFGPGLVTRLNRIAVRELMPITPRRPPPACIVEQGFAEPISTPEDMERSVSDLAQRVVQMLENRGEGGQRFEISFFRVDGLVRHLAIETGRPGRNVRTLVRLYKERLATLAHPIDPGFGLDLVRLSVPVTQPLDALQPDFQGRAIDHEDMEDLVDRLTTRLGPDQVLRFCAGNSHDPGQAGGLRPAIFPRPRDALVWIRPEPGDPPIRPIQVFAPPQPIETMAEVPDGPPIRFRWRRVLHEVTRAEGPERLAPEWWRVSRDTRTRDYYRVEDTHGHRFWLFRAGLYDQGGEPPGWYLHGLFA